MLCFFWLNVLMGNPTRSLPSYKEGKDIVNALLKNSIPIPLYLETPQNWEILEFPPKQRILKKFIDNKEVFYYHYKIKIPIYDKNKTIIDFRIEEIWLRISTAYENLSLSFLREDLLPGNFPVYIQ